MALDYIMIWIRSNNSGLVLNMIRIFIAACGIFLFSIGINVKAGWLQLLCPGWHRCFLLTSIHEHIVYRK